MVRLRLLTATLAVGLLAFATPALAHSTSSTNWAGYAIHRSGASFHQVVGVWREPSASCHRGQRTFSSYWIGLGGYSAGSKALEQAGTEVDCTSEGRVRTFAWFELVPAPSVRVGLKVPPGDFIKGTVTVTGGHVRISLADLTRHTAYSKVVPARVLDLSSAEWIVEAPSYCPRLGRCVTLPLADFGSTTFSQALVRSAGGHLGAISDPQWWSTRIRLVPRNGGYVSTQRGFGPSGEAAPSVLRGQGSAFSVAYAPLGTRLQAVGGGRLETGALVHRGRRG